jgi:uncharacterized protein YbcI
MTSMEPDMLEPPPDRPERDVSGGGLAPGPSVEGAELSPGPAVEGAAVSPSPAVEGAAVSPSPAVEGAAVSPSPAVDGAALSPSPSVEISNAVARLHKHYVGRGPTNARTTIDGDLVVCLLEGGYTRAEQTLEEIERADVVAAGRLGLQAAMRDEMIDAVQRSLRCRVRSFMSANDLRRNLQIEVFVLDRDSRRPN